MKISIVAIILLAVRVPSIAQEFQNLDFETIDDEVSLPKEWFVNEETSCDFAADSSIAFSGKLSFRLNPTSSFLASTTIINDLKRDTFKGKKTINLRVRYRSVNAENKISILTKQLDRTGNQIVTGPGKQSEITDTKSDWSILSYEQQIDSLTEHLAFGVHADIEDTVWLDSFELYLDGIKHVDGKAPLITKPSRNEIQRLRKLSIPMDSVDYRNLSFLKKELSNSRIVALGEVTHGSRQIYNYKSMLIKYLVESCGYTLLCMEMPAAEAELLNNYVLNGGTDPKTLLLSTSYWPWMTEEFLALLEWMNAYNRENHSKVQLSGFGINMSRIGLDSVLAFANKKDTVMYEKALSFKDFFDHPYHQDVDKLKNFISQVDAFDDYVRLNERQLVASSSQSKYDKIKHEIIALKQTGMYYLLGATTSNSAYRDQTMAENVYWSIATHPREKVMIWAHNAHISKGEDGAGMGLALKQRVNFFSLGFALGSGHFVGADLSDYGRPMGLTNFNLKAPVSDSYESYFVKGRRETYFVNLSTIRKTSRTQWLFDRHKFRWIGATIVGRYQFAVTSLSSNFDGIVFIHHSDPSRLIF